MTAESVEQVRADAVKRGDVIWAPDDGDWLKVVRIGKGRWGELTFYRRDHSEAQFDADHQVLRQAGQ